ncbi:exopolysaccharide transport family protein [Tautonia rosea]|uniref:exopolysaccharide transport family protein n=1 Tax=Tautonia rosea TaxID=2728037 RepID=UPI001472D493|nr:polysaccharide biosynthesis tyrosine autokinase [Tautonia rosea]
MDTADTPRPRHELARFTELPPALRTPLPPVSPASPASSGGLPISPRLVLRGLARHWWQALLLWIVGSAALASLVYLKYEPTYRASSQVLVNPDNSNPYANQDVTARGLADPRMQTHLQLVNSPRVLSQVLLDSQIVSFDWIRQAESPESALNEVISVTPGKSSALLFEVAAETPGKEEAPKIVNAVVQAFLALDDDLANERAKGAIEALEEHRADLTKTIDDLENEVMQLAKESDLPSVLRNFKDTRVLPDVDTDPQAQSESDGKITVEVSEYKRLHQELLNLEYAEIEARSELEAVRRQAATANPRSRIEDRVEQAFLSNETVRALRDALRDLDVQYDEARRRIRNPGDPALTRLQADRQRLMERYNQLWDDLEPTLRAQLSMDENDPTVLVRQAEQNLNNLGLQRKLIQEKLDRVKFEEQSQGEKALEMNFLLIELAQQRKMQETVDRRLEALKFDSENGRFAQNKPGEDIKATKTFTVVNPAQKAELQVNKRDKLMAITPMAMLGLVLGLVTLVEMRGGRVSGPDDLSGRFGADVFSVPPLPTVRSDAQGRLEAPGRDPKFEQFVQQLDHVRVALCGEGGHDGRGRCVLITSAVGGEGKTTLAAQLAVRCAEAGASTVLIDADLRRATLGRLFEVPDCPGLSDVLRGDATLEDALVPINQVGGCQLLPAGSPEANPNRILRGKNFAPMLERLRRTFDVVIIDTSPVLPVPDALILGRLADGAVIATRHDQSRFPAVERANNLLTGAGIPVLGVVVNGARPSGSRVTGGDYYAAYMSRNDRVPGDSGNSPVV